MQPVEDRVDPDVRNPARNVDARAGPGHALASREARAARHRLPARATAYSKTPRIHLPASISRVYGGFALALAVALPPDMLIGRVPQLELDCHLRHGRDWHFRLPLRPAGDHAEKLRGARAAEHRPTAGGKVQRRRLAVARGADKQMNSPFFTLRLAPRSASMARPPWA